jgi:hypothetical protein
VLRDVAVDLLFAFLLLQIELSARFFSINASVDGNEDDKQNNCRKDLGVPSWALLWLNLAELSFNLNLIQVK